MKPEERSRHRFARALLSLSVVMAALLLSSVDARAQGKERDRAWKDGDRLERILEGLERGIEALQALGEKEEAARVARIAEAVRRERREARPENPEIREARRIIEVMRSAIPALLEAGRKDSAELVERAVRAREVTLEGRRGEEAQAIRKQAPGLGAQVELLRYASELWEEFGHEKKAAALRELSDRFLSRLRRSRERERGEDEEERREADEETAIMGSALPALREGGKEEAAELLERAIAARGRERGEGEGREARVRPPEPGETAEVLALAARLWREFGDREKARRIANLAERIRASLGARRIRDGEDPEQRLRYLEERIEHLERMIREMGREPRGSEREGGGA